MLKASAGAMPAGKGSKMQTLAPGQKDVITGGDALARQMGQYGKTVPAYLPQGGTGITPSAHPGSTEIRGGSGGMKTHPRTGGIGPGTMGAVGPTNPDATTDPDQT